MGAAAKLQQSERLEAAALHRLLRGRSKKKRSAARRRRREKRLRTTDVEARLESVAAVSPIGRASEKLTTASGDRQDVSTAASEFIGHDVLFMKPGASRRNKVRAVTWNAGKGFRGNKFDFFLDYITGKEDERGERPGFDFAAVQELGPSWSSCGQARLWQTRSGEACVRKAPPLRETRAPQSAKQRRKAYQKLIGSEDYPLPATNTGWRAHFTQHAMLAWRIEWESRRRGQPLVAPDGRTIGAQFSTAAGRVGVISHYGLASPSHLVEDPEATAGTNSASVQRGLLDMVADFRDCCKWSW